MPAPGAVLAGCAKAASPCEVGMGSYHIALPDAPADTPLPVVIFLHGAGSNGGNVLRNRAMVNTILSRGYALIAPNGAPREGRFGTGWSFHPDFPARRDEHAFLDQVLEDATARFGLDRNRVLLSGFSIGGSMATYIACSTPDDFAAFAPVGGSFWRPHPAGCAGPVRLLHTHGWRDTTVPLEGRPLRGGAIYQGDVFQAMQILRDVNGCTMMRADSFETDGPFWRRRWERCTAGSALELALFDGGHRVPEGWADMALDWFESLPPKPRKPH